jgi:hypothetical protein
MSVTVVRVIVVLTFFLSHATLSLAIAPRPSASPTGSPIPFLPCDSADSIEQGGAASQFYNKLDDDENAPPICLRSNFTYSRNDTSRPSPLPGPTLSDTSLIQVERPNFTGRKQIITTHYNVNYKPKDATRTVITWDKPREPGKEVRTSYVLTRGGQLTEFGDTTDTHPSLTTNMNLWIGKRVFTKKTVGEKTTVTRSVTAEVSNEVYALVNTLPHATCLRVTLTPIVYNNIIDPLYRNGGDSQGEYVDPADMPRGLAISEFRPIESYFHCLTSGTNVNLTPRARPGNNQFMEWNISLDVFPPASCC